MPVTLLQIVDDAKFKEFLKMPGSWRVQKKIKLIFAEILEDITGNKAETSNTSDLHKVVTLFISKKNTHALNSPYPTNNPTTTKSLTQTLNTGETLNSSSKQEAAV